MIAGPRIRLLIKELMDDRCFQLMREEVHLEGRYRVVKRTVEGGAS